MGFILPVLARSSRIGEPEHQGFDAWHPGKPDSMSTLPPDRPTEQLRPMAPTPVIEQRVVAPALDPNAVLLRLEDAMTSLRGWLVVVGLIAVAGLGVGIYALTNGSGSGSRDGLANDARVDRISRQLQALRAERSSGGSDTTALGDRIDRLSRQVQTLRAAGSGSGGDTAALGGRVDTLESTVKTLSSRSSSGASAAAVKQLSDRVDAISRDVDQLKQGQTP
jgi:outer membrane murein-binding lipoprotein Lpp